jgi:hypothetical protein
MIESWHDHTSSYSLFICHHYHALSSLSQMNKSFHQLLIFFQQVLFEKKLYSTHSNQIKRFQIQILMSSKSLTRNDEMIFDLQINLKIKHSRRIDNLHINMKNEHYSMIRRYDHVFLLWNISAQSLIAKSLDQNSCFLIEIELRRLH